jgi:hypothetical protein
MTFVGAPGVYGQGNNAIFPVGATSSDKYVAVNKLNQQHPEFASRFEAWVDLSLMYEGGSYLKAKCERVLKKRPREDEEVYAARMDRFTYQNILGTGLGWYGAAMFDTLPEIFFDQQGKKRDTGFFSDFLENCDGLGLSYIDFWKKTFQFLLTYGSAWVLTDLTSLGEGEEPPKTLEEEKSRGLLEPHLAAYTPLNVINWRTDERGELRWAVIKTEVEDQDFLGEREIVTTWYYYDRAEYRVYEDRRKNEEQVRVGYDDTGRMAVLIRRGQHALSHKNRLPVRRVLLSEGLWLANRAYLLLVDHLNQDNTLAWSLFMSNLAIPIIIGDVDTTNMTQTESGYLQFPAGTEYMWSEPEGKSFVHSAKRVESLREECFRSMNLQAQGRSMRATPAMQSGKSKQLEMSPAKQILAGMGDDLRRHMQDVLVDVRDAHKDEGIHPDVRGFTFQEDMTTEEVFAVSSVLSIKVPSELFEKYLYKKVAKAWMVDANREEIDKVYKEIDAGPTIEEREEDEFKKRVEMAKQGLKGALGSQGNKGALPSPGSKGPIQPPGRGGAGPSPNTPK